MSDSECHLGIIAATNNPAAGRYSFAARANLEAIIDITPDEFENLDRANRELSVHRDRLQFLDIVHWNLEEYLGLEEHLLLEGFDHDGNPLRSRELDLNRRVMNLLSSIRSFLDHTETDLKRRFGPQSERYERFRKLTSALYDRQFSYRFLYRFRNFVQHCGLPLDVFGHQASPHSRTRRCG